MIRRRISAGRSGTRTYITVVAEGRWLRPCLHGEDGLVACPSAPQVTLPSDLCVARTETHDMPFYLRTIFRVLSSWVHRGVFAELPGSARRFAPDSPMLPLRHGPLARARSGRTARPLIRRLS